MNSIEIKNLSKHYKAFSLKNVSFNVNQGYITGLIGKNGAGKTTIIKSIIGSIINYDGDIKIFNKDLNNNCELKEDIGIVMDNIFYPSDWQVKDIDKTFKNVYKNWDSDLFKKHLKEFGIDENKKIKELSRGMKVKTMLASAFSHKAKILILDEPTSGLDPVARDELLDILLMYLNDENNTIIFSTHITRDLEKIADFIVCIDDGAIKYNDSKDKVMEEYIIIKGDKADLDASLHKKIIGLQINDLYYSGMIKSKDKMLFKKGSFEKISLDEFVIYMSKGETYHD